MKNGDAMRRSRQSFNVNFSILILTFSISLGFCGEFVVAYLPIATAAQ